MDQAAVQGTEVLYPSQHVDKLDVAVRRAVRVFVGNWANQRFVQNMSKIPPHRFRLLIYFLSYTQNLQLANTQIKTF